MTSSCKILSPHHAELAMEDLGEHMKKLVKSDDEGQEAETITVKLTLKQENIPALGTCGG